jgi:hypothetical protein
MGVFVQGVQILSYTGWAMRLQLKRIFALLLAISFFLPLTQCSQKLAGTSPPVAISASNAYEWPNVFAITLVLFLLAAGNRVLASHQGHTSTEPESVVDRMRPKRVERGRNLVVGLALYAGVWRLDSLWHIRGLRQRACLWHRVAD